MPSSCTRCHIPEPDCRPGRRQCRACEAELQKRRRDVRRAPEQPTFVSHSPKHAPVPRRPVPLATEPGPSILVIPDTQVAPGTPTEHLRWIGKYINHKRPDYVVCLGDWWDFPSLSSYDSPASKVKSGFSTFRDYEAGADGVQIMMVEVERPEDSEWVFVPGNHENRRKNALAKNPELDIPDWRVALWAWGWKVYEFLEVAEIEGVHFSHYFVRGPSGSVTQTKRGQPSAKAQAQREKVSTVAGHKQGLDVHIQESSGGRIRSIIAGSCYLHDPDYMSPQGADHWRGILLLNDVRDGDYELVEVSLRYLARRYG